MKTLNDVAFFALELATLVAFGAWGWQVASGPLRFVLVVAAPLLMVVTWGALAAPNAAGRLQDPYLLVFQLAVFVLGAIALITVQQVGWGVALGVVAVVVVSLDRVLS